MLLLFYTLLSLSTNLYSMSFCESILNKFSLAVLALLWYNLLSRSSFGSLEMFLITHRIETLKFWRWESMSKETVNRKNAGFLKFYL